MSHQKWWILVAIGAGSFLATFDAGIVSLALPAITREFQIDLVRGKWVLVTHLLSLVTLLLPVGSISLRTNRRLIVGTGFLLFAIGSWACAYSTSFVELLFGRAIQGIASACLMSNGPAIIAQAFTQKSVGRAVGLLAIIVNIGLLSGPVFGGALLDLLGWRALFYANLPIALAASVLSLGILPKNNDFSTPVKSPFDLWGSILQGIGIVFLIFSLSTPKTLLEWSGYDLILRISLFFAACISFFLLIGVEKRALTPLIHPYLMKSIPFRRSLTSNFFMIASATTTSILLPFYFTEVVHFSSLEIGLRMGILPFVGIFLSPWAGQQADRHGGKQLAQAAALTQALAMFSLAIFLSMDPEKALTQWGINICLIALGAAIALFQSPNNRIIINCIENEYVGAASAVIAVNRNMGLIIGAGLTISVYSGVHSLKLLPNLPIQAAFVSAALLSLSAWWMIFKTRTFSEGCE